MAQARARWRPGEIAWPGFVGALSAMLLGMIFLLSFFTLAQYYLSRAVIGTEDAVMTRDRQIAELTARLAAAQDASQAHGQAEAMNQQIDAMRRERDAREAALAASETRGRDQDAKIALLDQRLNAALAQKVEELARYRSDFFARLQQVLGGRPGMSVVGDRFILQSEILFGSGQAKLNSAGKGELDKVAAALLDLDHAIPPDIPWVMRVDGHTDKMPIVSKPFASNWALSSARAIAVVEYLIGKGVPPQRLAAAGFGEFQPLDAGEGEAALARNRRIELKITEK